eukprot:5803271-Prorocentrum_lima.AAC.1
MGPGQAYVHSDTFGLFYFKEQQEAGMLALTDQAFHIVKMLNKWLLSNKPDLPLPQTTITLNKNDYGCPHRDPNEGPTYMA